MNLSCTRDTPMPTVSSSRRSSTASTITSSPPSPRLQARTARSLASATPTPNETEPQKKPPSRRLQARTASSLPTDTVIVPRSKLLTLAEVARELRCSKAHVSNLIARRVRYATPLPVVQLGRRKLVRREALDAWIRANERAGVHDKLPASSESDVVRRIRGGI